MSGWVELFSESQLLAEIGTSGDKPVDGIVSDMMKRIDDHAGSAPQSDDIAMLVFRYSGPGSG